MHGIHRRRLGAHGMAGRKIEAGSERLRAGDSRSAGGRTQPRVEARGGSVRRCGEDTAAQRARRVIASSEMALGELTKQLAQQALGNQMKDVIDTLRPPDLSSISESLRTAKPVGATPADNIGATILGQIQAMQNAVKEDQELVVLVSAGSELIRVLELFVPSWRVFVLTGIDSNKNVTR